MAQDRRTRVPGETFSSTSPTKRRSRRSGTRYREKIQWLQRALVASVCLLLLVVVAGVRVITNGAGERARLMSDLQRSENVVLTQDSELEELRDQSAALIRGRIPGLSLLEFDRVVTLADSYLRTITFTLVHNPDLQSYEYHVVLHNREAESLTPNARVLFFDEVGIQVGLGLIQGEELSPNEVRSYTGKVDLISNSTPLYFAVETRSGMLSVEQFS